MSVAPVIAAEALHTYYGRSHILRGVDFAVGPGEAVSLLGRNGMGKTTLLRSMLGLTRPRSGDVRVHGRSVTGDTPWRIAREGIAFVPEGRGIFPNLTVDENLVMAAGPGHDGRRDWTRGRVLDLFPRLAERLGNFGNQLSGGEQQMLTIGRALLTNPALLILDEATEGLAPIIRQDIWRVIRTIKAAGIAIVIVDKNVSALLDLADRQVILVKGEVAFAGTSAALRAQPELLHRHLGV
jgi:branched-chain amino acid transport system ATP-binding protein